MRSANFRNSYRVCDIYEEDSGEEAEEERKFQADNSYDEESSSIDEGDVRIKRPEDF